jgi:hypothetical protein
MVRDDSPRFSKPDRSEDSVSLEEKEDHERKVRAFLEANTPKRKLKPARSDADDLSSNGHDGGDDTIQFDPPERVKYLQLVANGVPLKTTGSGEVMEDFTESEYYKHMAAIDKEHYTTGSGFIQVEKTPQSFHLYMENPRSRSFRERYRCNPGRLDDWGITSPTSTSASYAKEP